MQGRDNVSGLPRTVALTTEQVREALAEPVSAIVDAVKTTLDKTPPELAASLWKPWSDVKRGGLEPPNSPPCNRLHSLPLTKWSNHSTIRAAAGAVPVPHWNSTHLPSSS